MDHPLNEIDKDLAAQDGKLTPQARVPENANLSAVLQDLIGNQPMGRVVKWRARNNKTYDVWCQVLTYNQEQDCKILAQRWAASKKEFAHLEDDRFHQELACKAFYLVEDGKKTNVLLCLSPEVMGQKLLSTEIVNLCTLYALTKREQTAPEWGEIESKEQLDDWTLALAKESKQAGDFLASLAPSTVASICVTLAKAYFSLRTTSQPEQWRDISELYQQASASSISSFIGSQSAPTANTAGSSTKTSSGSRRAVDITTPEGLKELKALVKDHPIG